MTRVSPAPAEPEGSPAPEGGGTGVGERVAGATVLIAAIQIAVKACAFLSKWVVSLLGVSRITDAYFTAENILGKSYQLKQDVMQPAFMPIFIQSLNEGGEAAAWRFARQVLALSMALIGAFTIFSIVHPAPLIDLFWRPSPKAAPEDVAATRALVSSLAQWMLLALPLLALSSMTYVILNAYKRFAVPASSDAFQNLTFFLVAAGGFLALGIKPPRPHILAVAFVCAAAARIGIHLYGLQDKAAAALRRAPPEAAARPVPWRAFLLLAFPLLASFGFALWRDINENRQATFAAEGIYSIISLTKRIWSAPLGFLPAALSLAMFPFLCELHAKGDREGFARVVRGAFRFVLFAFLPMAALSLVLREPVVSAAYARGSWTDAQVLETARALGLAIWAIPIFALEYVLVQSFYAMRITWIPVVVGILASGLQIPLTNAGVAWTMERPAPISIGGISLGALDPLAVLALAYPVTRLAKNWVLGLLLFRRIGGDGPRTGPGFLVRVLAVAAVSAAAAAAAVWAANRALPTLLHLPGPILAGHGLKGEIFRASRAGAGFLAGCAAFVASAHLLRIPEWRMLVEWVRARLARLRKPAPGPAAGG